MLELSVFTIVLVTEVVVIQIGAAFGLGLVLALDLEEVVGTAACQSCNEDY